MSHGGMMEFDIRPERPEDGLEIRALVAAAFRADSDTADFVEAVRAEAEVCLAEVATRAGAIVGQAQWCAAPLVVDGGRVKGAYLTCLSVEPAVARMARHRLALGPKRPRMALGERVRDRNPPG